MRASYERRALGLQPASLVRVESALGTPYEPVDVVADVLDDHEGVTVVGSEQPDLSRQARGALSEYRVAGGPGAANRCSPGGCSKCGASVLLNDFEF